MKSRIPKLPPANVEADAPLPGITMAEVEAVVDYLQSLEHSQRRPSSTARLLVLVVKLWQAQRPWPTRSAAAEHVGSSLPLVDLAISQRRAQGLISVELRTARGAAKKRALSSISEKYIQPIPELIRVVAAVGAPTTAPHRTRVARRG